MTLDKIAPGKKVGRERERKRGDKSGGEVRRQQEGRKKGIKVLLTPSFLLLLSPPKCRVYVSILPFDFLPDLMTAGSARKLIAV